MTVVERHIEVAEALGRGDIYEDDCGCNGDQSRPYDPTLLFAVE
jgi:hypothetical protein